MKAVVEFDESVGRQLESMASREGKTVEEIVRDAAISLLSRRAEPDTGRGRVELPVAGDAAHRMTDAEFRQMIEEAGRDDDLRRMGGAGRDSA